MSETNYAKCSNFFVITFLTIFINFCTSAPVDVTPNAYTQFLAELSHNHCSVPTQVQLPFNATKANDLEYLSSYLEICQKTKSTKRNKEAVVLCKEIFDNVRNISCPPKLDLSDTIRVNLSGNVCKDIGAMSDSVPEVDTSLLRRMTDHLLCEIMCDTEFEMACQVLLWSFEVRKQIASVASVPKPEMPNVPGDGGDTNVDSFKQDNIVVGNALPEINVDPENGKLNAEEAKDVNEGVGPAGDAEVPEPGKLGENPEPKDDNLLIPGVKEKQEKPVLSDKDAVSENQAVPEDGGQGSTSASKSTSSTKTPSSVTQQKPDAQASDTEVEPVEKTTKTEADSQNTNKLQGDVTKYDEIHTGAELPQGSNTNTVPDEQTQDAHGNTLADGAVQDKKDSDIPLGDEDNNPGNEIPGEMSEIGDKNADVLTKNELPHESANEKSPNDAAADLPNNELNPSNLFKTIDQNKLAITTSTDDSFAKKTNSSTTSNQTTKDTTQQQTVQETTRDKTSIAGNEPKADKPVTNSESRKVEEIQDHTKTDSITPDLTNDEGTKKPSSDQTKPKVAQQTEEFDNTIPDITEKPVISDKKPPEKSQKLKPTSVNPDAKSVIPSSLTETSTKPAAPLEKMEGGGDDREPADGDHYGDQENTEGDEYPVPDYDGGFGEVAKNKAPNPDVPGPITAAKESIGSSNDRPMEFSRNRFGQDSSDIQMISTFPEQEDGHFFFYFLSIVLILMAGYLIFHNKQKIIALIVEGRHERNRRSHRIGYKKLETK